ncbi:MAG: DUF882 domain-containing protein [Gemmatimonas sp.]
MSKIPHPSRRLLLRAGAGAVVAGIMRPAHALVATGAVRSLAFDNLHTGEKLAVDYFVDGRYVPEALTAVNRVLRDFRTGEIHTMEPALLDLLVALRAKLETSQPLHVISGYRSPATNAKLHEASSGVASNSLHMRGMAIDLRVPGCALPAVRQAALSLQRGGVGYYPRSDFVHVDIGRVRTW